MFSILVNEKGGESKRLEFDKPEVTIGRVQGNDIILPKGNVSKRHSRIVLKDGKFIIVDLKSTNGTYVNGRKITSPLVVKNTDKIYVGDFILTIDEAGAGAVAEEPAAPPVAPPRPRVVPAPSAPPPPPRRVAEEQAEQAAGDDEGDHTLGQSADAKDEPPIEAPPPRRPTVQAAAPAPSIRPAPAPAPRAAEPPRPGSRQDVPVIAPSRPSVPPRPAPAAPAPQAPIPAASSAPPPAAPRPRPIVAVAPAPVRRSSAAVNAEGAEVARPDGGKRARIIEALRSLGTRLITSLGSELQTLRGDALRERAEAVATEVLAELAQETGLPPGIEPDQLLRDAVAEVVGLGPLDELILDESVHAITISRPDRIFVDRTGQARSLVPRWFSSSDAAHRVLSRLADRAGRTAELADARQRGGLFEARLDGGFALSAALGPLASGSVSMVVRRGRRDASRLADLAQQGVMSTGMAEFLELAVRARRNVLVSGISGSGRSTLVAAMLRATEGQRVVLVEESAELDGGDLPWISLSGAGGDARRAFSSALRMKPERVAIGDVRGAEALDLISSMAGGLDGAIFGITAGSIRDALGRLNNAARLAPEAPAVHVLDGEIGQGVHLSVLLARTPEGESRIVEIAEINPGAEGPLATPVFSTRGEGAQARFAATGHVPAWAEGAPASMFRA